jgi:hypothetical protein
MKRKVYVTTRVRKADQIKGFWAFPFVNVPLWFIVQTLQSQVPIPAAAIGQIILVRTPVWIVALPWLVNGSVLILAFIFRPQFAVGYVAFIASAFTVVIALSVLFVAACFVSILSAAVIGPLAILLFAILMLVGLYYLGRLGVSVFRSWQSSNGNSSHENGESAN